jgi:polyferredoxin
MVVSLTMRTPFKVDVVRDRGVMARMVGAGNIENIYRLQVMNATEAPQRYKITASGLPGLALSKETIVSIASTEAHWVPVQVVAPPGAAAPGSHPIQFEIESLDSPGRLVEKSAFLIPR